MVWTHSHICFALSLFVVAFPAEGASNGPVLVFDSDDAALELLQVQASRLSQAPQVIRRSFSVVEIAAEIAESAADEVMAVVDPQGKDDVSNIVKDGLVDMISEVALNSLEAVQSALDEGKNNKQAEEAAFKAVKDIVQSEIDLLEGKGHRQSLDSTEATEDMASRARMEDDSIKTSLVGLAEETGSHVPSDASSLAVASRKMKPKGPSSSIIMEEGFQAMLSQVVTVALEAAQEAIDAGKSQREAQKATLDAVKSIVKNEIGALTDEATEAAGQTAIDATEKSSHVAEKKVSAKLSVKGMAKDVEGNAGDASMLAVTTKKQSSRSIEQAERKPTEVLITFGTGEAEKIVTPQQRLAPLETRIPEEERGQGQEDMRLLENAGGDVLWPRFGSENSKCNSPAGALTRLEHHVSSQFACQVEALEAGHTFYSFTVPEDGHDDCPANRGCCRTTSSCARITSGTNWPWQIFMATEDVASRSQSAL